MMTLGSLFDGIGVWTLAAERIGILPVWSSEIEKFPREVTARHFPNSIQLGDINQITDAPEVDIITAGSPCQDISIAGKQGGIHRERSGLFFKAIELVRRIRPEFFVWENVPNVLHIHGGADFRAVLEEILQTEIPIPQRSFSNAGLVDGERSQVAWRILDSQYWGTAQRRKRVFLVADFTGRRAAQILFEPASLRRNSAPCTSAQNKTAAGITFGISRNSTSTIAEEIAPTLSCEHDTVIAYGIDRAAFNQGRNAQFKPQIVSEMCPSLTARGAVAAKSRIRRLTPVECERLMGLPSNWTAGGSDTARYKAIGNAMALPIAEFILRRIREENQQKQRPDPNNTEFSDNDDELSDNLPQTCAEYSENRSKFSDNLRRPLQEFSEYSRRV